LDLPEESHSLFERLRKEHPGSSYWADATFRLAQSAFEANDTERARQLVAEVLAGRPGAELRENSLYLQGQIAMSRSQWDEAARSFETLIREFPDGALRLVADYGAAEAAFRQNDYQAALERFDRLARQTRGRPDRWLAVIALRLAQTLCHRKQWDEAYQVASKIAEEYPDFQEQYEVDYVIGRCLSTRAEFEQAREAYRKVIRSSQGAKTETAAKAQLMIAESHYHQKNYEAALREYLALEILYDYPAWQAAAVFQAGKCHEMLGEWKQAVEQYRRLLEAYPDTSFTQEATERLQAAGRQAGEPSS
jgi:TolA-binding protein